MFMECRFFTENGQENMIKNRLFTKTNIMIPCIKSIANNAENDFFCKWNFLTIKFASITSGTLLASALFDMIALANAIFKSFHIFFILLIFKKNVHGIGLF